MKHKVFVYGSLLSGMGNHHILENSTFLGHTVTTPDFAMIDLGGFPGLINYLPGVAIKGEVYEVNDTVMARLDRLEGYHSDNPTGGLYNRQEINTEFGEAIVYIYNNRYRADRFVTTGDWRSHLNNKRGII